MPGLFNDGSFTDPEVESFFDETTDGLHYHFTHLRESYQGRSAYLKAYRQRCWDLVRYCQLRHISLADIHYLVIDLKLMLRRELRELEYHQADVARRLQQHG